MKISLNPSSCLYFLSAGTAGMHACWFFMFWLISLHSADLFPRPCTVSPGSSVLADYNHRAQTEYLVSTKATFSSLEGIQILFLSQFMRYSFRQKILLLNILLSKPDTLNLQSFTEKYLNSEGPNRPFPQKGTL